MVCFCKQSAASLQAALSIMASESFTLSAQTSESLRVTAVANWMAARGLPSAPWAADAAWLELQLPVPKLKLSAIATLGAMAQLRAQVLAQFNIDLLAGGAATPLIRLIATLNARLSAVLSATAMATLSANASVLAQLAARLEAAESVTLAASLNLFLPSESLLQAYLAPGGIELNLWAAFLDALAALAPLIALSLQLGISDPASLAQAIRLLKAIEVPVLANLSAVLQILAAFAAVARLQAVLGINVLEAGMAQVSAMVALRVQAAFALIPPSARPPRISLCPSLLATADVVTAAMSPTVQMLANLEWNVPSLPALPALASLLPALSLTATLSAALQMPAVQLRPCVVGCDAAAILRAL